MTGMAGFVVVMVSRRYGTEYVWLPRQSRNGLPTPVFGGADKAHWWDTEADAERYAAAMRREVEADPWSRGRYEIEARLVA